MSQQNYADAPPQDGEVVPIDEQFERLAGNLKMQGRFLRRHLNGVKDYFSKIKYRGGAWGILMFYLEQVVLCSPLQESVFRPPSGKASDAGDLDEYGDDELQGVSTLISILNQMDSLTFKKVEIEEMAQEFVDSKMQAEPEKDRMYGAWAGMALLTQKGFFRREKRGSKGDVYELTVVGKLALRTMWEGGGGLGKGQAWAGFEKLADMEPHKKEYVSDDSDSDFGSSDLDDSDRSGDSRDDFGRVDGESDFESSGDSDFGSGSDSGDDPWEAEERRKKKQAGGNRAMDMDDPPSDPEKWETAADGDMQKSEFDLGAADAQAGKPVFHDQPDQGAGDPNKVPDDEIFVLEPQDPNSQVPTDSIEENVVAALAELTDHQAAAFTTVFAQSVVRKINRDGQGSKTKVAKVEKSDMEAQTLALAQTLGPEPSASQLLMRAREAARREKTLRDAQAKQKSAKKSKPPKTSLGRQEREALLEQHRATALYRRQVFLNTQFLCELMARRPSFKQLMTEKVKVQWKKLKEVADKLKQNPANMESLNKKADNLTEKFWTLGERNFSMRECLAALARSDKYRNAVTAHATGGARRAQEGLDSALSSSQLDISRIGSSRGPSQADTPAAGSPIGGADAKMSDAAAVEAEVKADPDAMETD